MIERFLRTSQGILNYPLIYGKPVVCVEGPDDVVFWDQILSRKLNFDAKIKPFGGKKELNKIADKIISLTIEKRKIIVIFDMDYSKLLGTQKKHPQIIYLNRYSIENYFLCKKNLIRVAKKISRTSENKLICDTVEEWRTHIIKTCSIFILYDLASQLHSKGDSIYTDNCSRFLKEECPWKFREDSIKQHIKIHNTCSEEELEKAKHILGNIDNNIFFSYIRGKFLMSSISNMMKHIMDKHDRHVSLSRDRLFENLVDSCSICDNPCKDFKEILRLLEHAISIIQDN